LEELVVGENAPPFHPNCGCSIIEFVVDEIDDGTRKPPVPPPGILGDRTENRIAELHPDFQENARMALYEMQQLWDDVRVVEAYRSPARSDDVAGTGHGVAAGKSNHNYGLAFDIGFFDENGRYMNGENADGTKNEEETKLLNELLLMAGEIGRKYGFEWGGDWSGRYCDPPHFQMPYGYSWRELMNLPLLEGSDYLRQVDTGRKYQPQPDGATSEPPAWER